MDQNIPEVIYHYCGINSFYKIISSGVIWASLYTSLNDYTEASWFYNKLVTKANGKWSVEHAAKLEKFLDNVFINIKDYFIASFSEKEDVLSQWRAYAEDGQGVAIGFFSDSFGIKKQIPTLSLDEERVKGIVKINYNEDLHDKLAEVIIEKVLSEENLFNMNFDSFILTTKNPFFVEEQEVRIVEVIDTRLNINPDMPGLRTRYIGEAFDFRINAKKDIVPYRNIPLFGTGERKLHSIYLGPRCGIHVRHMLLLLNKYKIEVADKIYYSKAT